MAKYVTLNISGVVETIIGDDETSIIPVYKLSASSFLQGGVIRGLGPNPALTVAGNSRLILNDQLADSVSLFSASLSTGTAVAHIIDTVYDLNTAGDKIVSFRNNGVEVAYIDRNGVYYPPSGGGVDTLAAIGSTPNANGATISGTTLNLQPASTSYGGVITTGAQTFSGAKAGAVTSLTSTSSSIAINLANNCNFSHTFTEDTTLAAPSNITAGQTGVITFTQHASSPKTLAFNSFWKFPGGTPSVPVTATNSAIDIMAYFIDPGGTFAICNILNDVKT